MVQPLPRLVPVAIAVLGLVASGCSILYSTDDISSESAPAPADGPSLCDGSSLLFCDGFENGFGATDVANGGASLTLDSTHVYRGGFALHSSMPPTAAGDDVAAQVLASQAWPAHVFVRFFVYLPSPWTIGTDVLTYVDATNAGVALFIPPPDPTVAIASFGVPAPDSRLSSTRAPLGKWICFELEVDSTTDAVNAWMDGNALRDLSESVPVGPAKFLSVGLLYGSASGAWPAYEAWFDEFAVDTKPIGCAR